MKQKIIGGKADKKNPKDFDQDQLKAGVEVEMEHTEDMRMALEIAMDHLTEDAHYYKKLKDAGLADELDKSQPLEKMSRPKIRFPNLPKVSSRPDQQVSIVENDRQKKLVGRKVAQQRYPDGFGRKTISTRHEDGTVTSQEMPPEKISNQAARDIHSKKAAAAFDSRTLGLTFPNSKPKGEPYVAAAIGGKLKSKFEQKDDPEFKEKQKANLEADDQKRREYNLKLRAYLDENKGNLSYADLTRFQKENRPKKTVTRGKMKNTKDLAPDQMMARGRAMESTIEHEAAHGLFKEISRHYGETAAQKAKKHIVSAIHPETRAVMSNWLTGKYRYDGKSPSFSEEIINHSRDLLINPKKRQDFRKFVGDEKYNEHIKNLKQGVQGMHERAKEVTPEWLMGEQEVQQPKKLAASELQKSTAMIRHRKKMGTYSEWETRAKRKQGDPKGVHKPNPQNQGTSEAGDFATGRKVPARDSDWSADRAAGKQKAFKLHREKLAELKAMPKPNLTKARVDEGKSVDEKRQARGSRAESWERENYGMQSGKSSTPAVSKFLHNAKLHQIKNSPKPNLTKARVDEGKEDSEKRRDRQQRNFRTVNGKPDYSHSGGRTGHGDKVVGKKRWHPTGVHQKSGAMLESKWDEDGDYSDSSPFVHHSTVSLEQRNIKPKLTKAEKTKPKLLGSAPDHEGIKKVIGRYWYSNDIRLVPNSEGTHDVHNGDKKIDGFKVREHKGRVRFEHHEPKLEKSDKKGTGPTHESVVKKLVNKIAGRDVRENHIKGVHTNRLDPKAGQSDLRYDATHAKSGIKNTATKIASSIFTEPNDVFSYYGDSKLQNAKAKLRQAGVDASHGSWHNKEAKKEIRQKIEENRQIKPKLTKAVPLEHYSAQQNLKQIDPKFKQTGVDARVKGRDTDHPHSFYYRAGSAPEDIVQSQAKSKYLVEIPDHAKLYDIGTDPENFVDQARNENQGVHNMDLVHQKIKESGHEGFYNSTHPQLSNVVALYHAHDVKEEGSAK